MLIYPLWLTRYLSGTGDQFFKKSLESLGNEVVPVPLDHHGCEATLIERLEKRKGLVFHVPYKDHFRNEVMTSLTKSGYDTMDFQGDDEWLWDAEKPHSPKFVSPCHKWTVTTYEPAIPRYKAIGVKPILSQWGYSSQEWKFKARERDIDVYFCGARNPERDKFLNRVANMGINYSVDGPGYGFHKNPKNKCKTQNGVDGNPIQGKVSFQEMVSKYQRAKISVSFLMGSGQKKPYTQVKQRVFEIPASGSFQLASACPGLSRFFNSKEIDTFDTVEEMESKIEFYLKHDSIRERMARRAMLRNYDYSYENIFKRIFKEVGL